MTDAANVATNALHKAKPIGSQRIAPFGETVFAKYTRLAQKHSAINLGQGFPDFDPPDFALEALRSSASAYQQYPPLPGMPVLSEAVAEKMASRLGREVVPVQNVQITVGATEALYAAMQALVDPGDEVILLEPFYDAYPADVLMAGGVPVYVPLHPQKDGAWVLELDELKKAFSPKTKAILLNTPHNPTGKVFSERELDAIIKLAHDYGATILSDEVYEHITFAPHVSIASRPGGWERTLTVSSIGKTFSITGWKVGWATGPEPLIHALRMAHQWIPFTVATPLQIASAEILRRADEAYYEGLERFYRSKRDLLVDALNETPFVPLTPQGGYFVMADSSALPYKDDVTLCENLPKDAGVGAIPPSAFYSPAHKQLAKHLVRFAFCKSDEAISEAGQRLKNLQAAV